MEVRKTDWAQKLMLNMKDKNKPDEFGNLPKPNPSLEDQMVEGVIALYKVSPTGGMQRTSQVDLNMGKKFLPTGKGNMVLTRSKDKKIVSVTNFD